VRLLTVATLLDAAPQQVVPEKVRSEKVVEGETLAAAGLPLIELVVVAVGPITVIQGQAAVVQIAVDNIIQRLPDMVKVGSTEVTLLHKVVELPRVQVGVLQAIIMAQKVDIQTVIEVATADAAGTAVLDHAVVASLLSLWRNLRPEVHPFLHLLLEAKVGVGVVVVATVTRMQAVVVAAVLKVQPAVPLSFETKTVVYPTHTLPPLVAQAVVAAVALAYQTNIVRRRLAVVAVVQGEVVVGVQVAAVIRTVARVEMVEVTQVNPPRALTTQPVPPMVGVVVVTRMPGAVAVEVAPTKVADHPAQVASGLPGKMQRGWTVVTVVKQPHLVVQMATRVVVVVVVLLAPQVKADFRRLSSRCSRYSVRRTLEGPTFRRFKVSP
jgi:hypothetical protein